MDTAIQGSGTATATMTTRRSTALMTAMTIIAFLLILLTVKAAMALTITEITAPSTVSEGQLLQLSFTTDTPASYRILEQGLEVSATNSYNEALGYDTAGLFTYTFEATDANGTIAENRTVEVVDLPLGITLEEPSGSDYATGTIPVALDTNIPADLCYTVSEAGSNTLTQVNATRYEGALSLDDGIQTVQFKCNRNGEIAEEERTLKVDTTPPVMSLGPSGNVDDKVVLTATTDEASNCRYGTSYGAYDDLDKDFDGTGTIHEEDLDLGEGSHTYYVACRDVYGNTAGTGSTTFTLREKPSARIEVEGGNPHKAGSYDFTLEVSEPLRETPTLSLNYQGGSASELVLTETSDTLYEGVIIIGEEAGERVATFSFSGTDLSGLVGTKIEEGELFLVDTIKPVKVTTFRAVNGTGGVNLSWYYEGEDDRFSIYRTDGLGVEYTDFHTTAIGDSYLDTDTTTAVKYYYRIAAMDDAGNVGPLSHEEWASPAAARHAAAEIAAFLDPMLQVDLDARISQVERHLLDAQSILDSLREEEDSDKAWLIATLGLDDDAGSSLKALKDAKQRLAALRSKDLSAGEFEREVMAIQKSIDGGLAKLAQDIEVTNRAEYDENPDEQAIDAAVTHALRGKVVAKGERNAYLEAARQLQDAVEVTTTITTASLTYADNHHEAVGIVDKRLLADEPQTEVIAIDTLPSSLVQRDLVFLAAEPVELQEGVYQYGYDSLLDQRIVYTLSEVESLPTLRQGALVLLPKPGVMAAVVENSITGKSFLSFGSGSQNLVLILGLIIIVGLAAYYLRLHTEDEPAEPPGPPEPALSQPGRGTHTIITQAGPASMSLAPAPMTQTVLVHRRHEPLVGLLLHGHELADETRYLDALHFYKQALARFEEERFSSARLKESVREELVLLYAKLSLLETMGKAHDACYVGDAAQLKELMHVMQQQAAPFDNEQSRLVEKATSEYQYFFNKLHTILKEKESELVRGSDET